MDRQIDAVGSGFAEVSKIAADQWLACEVEYGMNSLYRQNGGRSLNSQPTKQPRAMARI